MTNYEEIKQGLADYEAKVAKANAKFPERKNLKKTRVYSFDVEGFDYCSKSGFPGQYPLHGRTADYVSWAVVDDARLCRLCYSRNQCPL
ncbi:MAG: hypothetical protein ACLRXQ_02230 [Phascolarctobacterium faecium]